MEDSALVISSGCDKKGQRDLVFMQKIYRKRGLEMGLLTVWFLMKN